MVGQMLGDRRAEAMGEIGEAGLEHRPIPPEINLFNRRTEICEHCERGLHIGAHLGVDLEEAEIGRVGDAPPRN